MTENKVNPMLKPTGRERSVQIKMAVFPMTPQGQGPYGPQGHGWQDL